MLLNTRTSKFIDVLSDMALNDPDMEDFWEAVEWKSVDGRSLLPMEKLEKLLTDEMSDGYRLCFLDAPYEITAHRANRVDLLPALKEMVNDMASVFPTASYKEYIKSLRKRRWTDRHIKKVFCLRAKLNSDGLIAGVFNDVFVGLDHLSLFFEEKSSKTPYKKSKALFQRVLFVPMQFAVTKFDLLMTKDNLCFYETWFTYKQHSLEKKLTIDCNYTIARALSGIAGKLAESNRLMKAKIVARIVMADGSTFSESEERERLQTMTKKVNNRLQTVVEPIIHVFEMAQFVDMVVSSRPGYADYIQLHKMTPEEEKTFSQNLEWLMNQETRLFEELYFDDEDVSCCFGCLNSIDPSMAVECQECNIATFCSRECFEDNFDEHHNDTNKCVPDVDQFIQQTLDEDVPELNPGLVPWIIENIIDD